MHATLNDRFHDEPPPGEPFDRPIGGGAFEEPLHDWLEAYALGALDADDRERFEEHLPTCDLCRADLSAHVRMVDLLTYSLPPERPAEGARQRLVATIRSDAASPPPPRSTPAQELAAVLRSVPPAAARPAPGPARRQVRPSALLAGAALALLLGLGAVVGLWSVTGPHASPEVELLARLPGGRVLSLVGTGAPGAAATLFVVTGGSRAELVVDGLPPPPAGRVYQLWFGEPGQPLRSGGVFGVNSRGDGLVRVALPVPLDRVAAVAITQEAAPGVRAPTGVHLLDWTPNGAPVSK